MQTPDELRWQCSQPTEQDNADEGVGLAVAVGETRKFKISFQLCFELFRKIMNNYYSNSVLSV